MGTMEVLSVSPLTQSQIIFGKVLPYLLLSFINGCLIIAPWVWVLDMPMNGNLLLLTETLLLSFFRFLSASLFLP
jgi:ABC-2 type transport system permease protein